MPESICSLIGTALLICSLISSVANAEDLSNYKIQDDRLELQLIDSSPDVSFLSVSVDSQHQVFVGGREVVLVYEPDGSGGYRPPVELYRFPKDSWVYDIAFRGDDLYVSTVTTLYVIPNARKARRGLKAKPLLWGMPVGSYPEPTFGVHQGMHGLAWGPTGDLYISFGDPLWYYGDFDRPDHWGHWYFYLADGSKHPYNGVGGIARLHPDGSNFQVYATGLRNPCGLAFDNRWVLFSHDNDHESRPDLYVPGRLLHVSQGADFCWPRGWMVSKTPERKDLLHTMYDGMRRTIPVGQSYYGETRLPERYRDTLLLARWGQRSVTSYPKRRKGASFRAKEQTLFSCTGNARPVGVAAGPQGRIFAAVCYMSHNEKSPIYRSDLVVLDAKDTTPVEATAAVDVTKANQATLRALLDNSNWQLRQMAHLELLRRGSEALKSVASEFSKVDYDSIDKNLAAHAIPLLAAHSSASTLKALKRLSHHPRADIRLQAVMALSSLSAEIVPQEVFTEKLNDDSAAVQLAAIEALQMYEVVPEEVLREVSSSSDSYLRQAAVRLLQAKLSTAELSAMLQSTDDRIRLAAVLAMGRQLTIPSMNFIPPKELPLARTIGPQVYLDHDLIDLRELARIGNYTTADYWKTERKSLLDKYRSLMIALDDSSESVRLHAAFFLSLLKEEECEPLIQRVRETATDGQLAKADPVPVTEAWFCGPFADDSQDMNRQHGPELQTIDLGASFEQSGRTLAWNTLEHPAGEFGGLLRAPESKGSYYATFQIQSAARQRIWLMLRSEGIGAVWHNGRSIWYQHRKDKEAPPEDRVVVELEPGTNSLLIRIQVTPKDKVAAFQLRSTERIVVSAQPAVDSSLADRLQNASSSTDSTNMKPFLDVDWKEKVASGSTERGRKLFHSIGCVKCHAISNDVPVSGGPSLADAGRRFTVDYLVESVLLPGNKVSEFFRNSIIVTNGKTISGVITSDTSEQVEILQSNGERITILKEDIELQRESEQSPMPNGLVKTVPELQDLIAYLISDDASEGTSGNSIAN